MCPVLSAKEGVASNPFDYRRYDQYDLLQKVSLSIRSVTDDVTNAIGYIRCGVHFSRLQKM
jgi:hypothetical protein